MIYIDGSPDKKSTGVRVIRRLCHGRSFLFIVSWLWALTLALPDGVCLAQDLHFKLLDSTLGAEVTRQEKNPAAAQPQDSETRRRRVLATAQAAPPEKPLVSSLETVQKREPVLRQAQHERVLLIDSGGSSVRPELVEGRAEGFSTASDFAAQFALAKLLHFKGVEGDGEAAERAASMLVAFAQDYPHDPVVGVYLGSARLLEAKRTWVLWRKGTLSQEGLTLLDEAVHLAPENVEVRLIRGVSTYHLPALFGRTEQAAADIGWVATRAQDAVAAGRLDRTIAAAALFYEGLIRAARSEMDSARTAWQTAVALSPSTHAGKSAALRLRENDPQLHTRPEAGR